jgi:hypothetical protein
VYAAHPFSLPPFLLKEDQVSITFFCEAGMYRFILLLVIFSTSALWAQTAGTITTVAGNGTGGDTGDGGLATSAEIFISLRGTAPDTDGNLYILQGLSFVRKVNSAGIINTIAGGGETFTNNTPALDEILNITDVVPDNQGNYYLAARQFVLKVDAAGITTYFAGTLAGPGDSGDGGPATSAQVSPSNLAFDGAGNLYICEVTTNRIRKVDRNGIITTVAGTGQPGYKGDGGPRRTAISSGHGCGHCRQHLRYRQYLLHPEGEHIGNDFYHRRERKAARAWRRHPCAEHRNGADLGGGGRRRQPVLRGTLSRPGSADQHIGDRQHSGRTNRELQSRRWRTGYQRVFGKSDGRGRG